MSSSRFILAIDQGTTNTKVLLVDHHGAIRQQASRPVQCHFPQPGWVEQDALQVWQSVHDAMDACLQSAGYPKIEGIAITNQRESALVWDRDTGTPVGPVIIWQCRRTSAFCDQLTQKGLGPLIQSKTGLPIDPLFSASKIRWLIDQAPEGQARANQGVLCAGTIDSWLLWNLSGRQVHRCDVSNASRTQLMNINTAQWDTELLDLFDLPIQLLPEIKPSSAHFGETQGTSSVPASIPIVSMIGDSHAALFGQGGFQPSTVKATYGTGSSLMSPLVALSFSDKGIATTVAWGKENNITYALEGNISVTGSAVQWYASLLGMNTPEEAAHLAAQVDSSEGVYIVPAFVGLGAPYWNDKARGLITGITRSTTSAHVARAVLESIAFQIHDVFNVMVDSAEPVLLADGGGSRNDVLMQLQADILGCPVLRNNASEISALGTAYLAGLNTGFWSSNQDILSLPRSLDRFEPTISSTHREHMHAGWKDAIARTLYTPAVRHGE